MKERFKKSKQKWHLWVEELLPVGEADLENLDENLMTCLHAIVEKFKGYVAPNEKGVDTVFQH